MNTPPATLHDPKSGHLLAEISLDGDPFRADELLSDNGILQGFTILSNHKRLQQAWFNQEPLLFRTKSFQQLIKIITYPSDGENQGHFLVVEENCAHYRPDEEPSKHTRNGIARSLAFVGGLFGT